MVFVGNSVECWFKVCGLFVVGLFSGDVHIIEDTLVYPCVVQSAWVSGEVVLKVF